LFFLLVEDYIEAQSRFVRDLDQALERFARRMGDSGVLVRPFTGDIETTRSHVLSESWRPNELTEISRTPGLLMIDTDFDEFDPRQHRWLFIHLGERAESNRSAAQKFAEMSTELAEAVCDADTDVFDSVRAAINDVQIPDVAKVFEAKPGIFGFSVDLVAGAQLVHALWLKITKGSALESPALGSLHHRCSAGFQGQSPWLYLAVYHKTFAMSWPTRPA
jgi:hypothetical protein